MKKPPPRHGSSLRGLARAAKSRLLGLAEGVARPSPACVAQLYEDFENARGPHSAAVKAVGGPRRRAAAAAVGADGGFADVCGLARGEGSGSVLGSRSAESSSSSTAEM